MRVIAVVAAVLPLTLTGAPAAKSENLADAQAIAAFECAALAAGAAVDSPARGDVERLFTYGYEKAKASYPELRPALRKALGPLWEFAATKSDDFWIGASWMAANVAITKLVEAQAPIKTGDPVAYSVLKAARESTAMNEFRRRNCHLIGRR